MSEIGRLLRAGIDGCVVGCWVDQVTVPRFGGLVRIEIENEYEIYGMIHDIHVDDDGLVRQLLSAQSVSTAVIEDNRRNRNVPVEISVLFLGYQEGMGFYQMLPPRPPLSLDTIHPCAEAEIRRFLGLGFGYFRHLLRKRDLPVGEMLAAHLQQAGEVMGSHWLHEATQELIMLLRDDYERLIELMGALKSANLNYEGEE
ncbi:MAG: hypothetical protein JW750_09860 [Anaerolineaceae bacterium]|nr:hypothetical protein [Anaerolineaceae bacterium]